MTEKNQEPDKNLLEQVLDYDINHLDVTAERINEEKLVSKEAVDFLVKKNLDVLAYNKKSSEMRYLCDLLSKARIAVTDPLTGETKIVDYDPSDVLQEKKYRETWEKRSDIVEQFNLQTT